LWFGRVIGPATKRLMQCTFNHGMRDHSVLDIDWLTCPMRVFCQAKFPKLNTKISRRPSSVLCGASIKAELCKLALDRALLIAPVATIELTKLVRGLTRRGTTASMY
jgi:hypothetical protein